MKGLTIRTNIGTVIHSDKRKEPALACRFYTQAASREEPVREWLKSLPGDVMHEIGTDLAAVQWHWPRVGAPQVKPMGNGLWELRTRHDKNEYRVFFVVGDGALIALHGFQKKTQRTSPTDLELARKRQKEVNS